VEANPGAIRRPERPGKPVVVDDDAVADGDVVVHLGRADRDPNAIADREAIDRDLERGELDMRSHDSPDDDGRFGAGFAAEREARVQASIDFFDVGPRSHQHDVAFRDHLHGRADRGCMIRDDHYAR
jgi:hypothetical protein